MAGLALVAGMHAQSGPAGPTALCLLLSCCCCPAACAGAGDDAAALDCIDVKYDPDDVYTFPVDLSSDFAKLDAAECKAVLAQKAEAAGKWSKWLLEHAPARA